MRNKIKAFIRNQRRKPLAFFTFFPVYMINIFISDVYIDITYRIYLWFTHKQKYFTFKCLSRISATGQKKFYTFAKTKVLRLYKSITKPFFHFEFIFKEKRHQRTSCCSFKIIYLSNSGAASCCPPLS